MGSSGRGREKGEGKGEKYSPVLYTHFENQIESVEKNKALIM
jgi:hypothetical protein